MISYRQRGATSRDRHNEHSRRQLVITLCAQEHEKRTSSRLTQVEGGTAHYKQHNRDAHHLIYLRKSSAHLLPRYL
ncbi:hypothetical protein BJV74DRAFT_859338 [Russula compacta]|nr:hypothetical protein BJV74DRAFT_859338 [Russula compacta]